MKREQGMSLIGLMVALLVGMLVSLAGMGSASFFEAQRRSMTGGNTALENGVAALFTIQSDAKSAGLGLSAGGVLLCPTLNIWYSGATRAAGAPASPALIQAGATDAEPDVLTFVGAEALASAMPVPLIQNMSGPDSVLRTRAPAGVFTANELLLIGEPGSNQPCTLRQVTETVATPQGTDLRAVPGGMWNPPDSSIAFGVGPVYRSGALVQRVGTWNWRMYRVVSGNLEVVDLVTGQAEVVAENIVQLKAFYGTTDGTNGSIEQWVPATGAWATPTPTQIRSIEAIRVAVVARAPQRVKPVNGQCEATTAYPLSWPQGPVLDLSADPDWRCYTYRTFSLMMPLRNVTFSGVQP